MIGEFSLTHGMERVDEAHCMIHGDACELHILVNLSPYYRTVDSTWQLRISWKMPQLHGNVYAALMDHLTN